MTAVGEVAVPGECSERGVSTATSLAGVAAHSNGEKVLCGLVATGRGIISGKFQFINLGQLIDGDEPHLGTSYTLLPH
jgi:hypothetical protein